MRRTGTATRDEVALAFELRTGLLSWWRPWVVLINGLGFDRDGWRPVLDGLGRRFRLVLPDNRGVGESDVPPPPYRMEEMARDIVAVMDAAGIERAHVVGASLGGMIAQELAIAHPKRVGRLVLACTTPGWPFGYPFPAKNLQLLWESSRLPAGLATRRRIEHIVSEEALTRRPELADELMAYLRARPADPDGWKAQAAAGAGYTNRGRTEEIRARTLVVHGAEDAVVDPRNAELLASRIPDARLALFPEAGHLLFWEQPDAFVRAVTTFLTEPSPDDSPD